MTANFPELETLKLAVALPSYNGTRHNGPSLFYLNKTVPNAIPIATQTSLLATCFNITLTTAMVMRDRGEATHYLMLHDDIVPLHQNWFEQLWSAYSLPEGNNKKGMICAVSPIKDHRGLTSIAVETETGDAADQDKKLLERYAAVSARLDRGDVKEGDTLLEARLEKEILDRLGGAPPKRFFTKPERVTMKQCLNNPETFTHPGLLLNTGCLLFDLREPWVDQASRPDGRGDLYFTIQDHIEWIGGVPHPSSSSEDWNFTRMARSAAKRVGCELPVYATRAMQLDHVGQNRFPNYKEWGMRKDDGT